MDKTTFPFKKLIKFKAFQAKGIDKTDQGKYLNMYYYFYFVLFGVTYAHITKCYMQIFYAYFINIFFKNKEIKRFNDDILSFYN